MKTAYPVIFHNTDEGYVAYIPDFGCGTQGHDITEAIYMARDAIGLMGITIQDDGESIPSPSPIKSVKTKDGEFVSLIDIDFDEYRRKVDNRTVRRNVTLPSWLDEEARKSNINVSDVLRRALKHELHLD